jgi:hypothetical protein
VQNFPVDMWNIPQTVFSIVTFRLQDSTSPDRNTALISIQLIHLSRQQRRCLVGD